jgi:hypothetical protein
MVECLLYGAINCPVCNTVGHTARDFPELSKDKSSLAVPSKAAGDYHCRLFNAKAERQLFAAKDASTVTHAPFVTGITPSKPALGSLADPLPISLHAPHTSTAGFCEIFFIAP